MYTSHKLFKHLFGININNLFILSPNDKTNLPTDWAEAGEIPGTSCRGFRPQSTGTAPSRGESSCRGRAPCWQAASPW